MHATKMTVMAMLEDSEWPGATHAGVLYVIDGQLASVYSAGVRMYLNGPWVADAPPEQGNQLRFSPAELYRVGVEELREHVRRTYSGREFWDLEPQAMDELLGQIERGSVELPSLPSPVFFETLRANTVEGFFADPAYGGNRDMVGWRIVGFPGAYAQYLDLADAAGRALLRLGNSGSFRPSRRPGYPETTDRRCDCRDRDSGTGRTSLQWLP
jgi:gluconate 2-dehydrogenase gamma chain